jgi:hypothetical protein
MITPIEDRHEDEVMQEEAFAGVAGVSQEGDKAWQQDQAANSTCQLIARLPKVKSGPLHSGSRGGFRV